MDFLNCVKDAEKWDELGFSDPHFTSAYYRAWKKEGTLAIAHGCARPFLHQEPDVIGNAYNFGGTVAYDPACSTTSFSNDYDDWRRASNFYERCTLVPWAPNGLPIALDFGSVYVSAKASVYIDLTEKYEFRQTTKHEIRKAEKNRVKCEITEPTFDNAGVFEDLYNQSMRKKDAAPHWHYYPGFFYEVLRELGPQRAVLFLTRVGTDLECGCIVLHGGDTAYYHWAARAGKAANVGASHFQIFTVANWCRWQKMKRLHLGGGLERGDSLERFKLGFSKKTVPVFSYGKS